MKQDIRLQQGGQKPEECAAHDRQVEHAVAPDVANLADEFAQEVRPESFLRVRGGHPGNTQAGR